MLIIYLPKPWRSEIREAKIMFSSSKSENVLAPGVWAK